MDGKGELGPRTLAMSGSSGARLPWTVEAHVMAWGKPGSPVPHTVVNPVSGTDALESRCPVVKTGVEVQTVEQVGRGPDDPAEGERETQPWRSHLGLGQRSRE